MLVKEERMNPYDPDAIIVMMPVLDDINPDLYDKVTWGFHVRHLVYACEMHGVEQLQIQDEGKIYKTGAVFLRDTYIYF